MRNRKPPPSRLPPLPSREMKRWTARRKAAVLEAIADGRMTAVEACGRWNLSPDEIEAWEWAYGLFGLSGLRATRIRRFRAALRAHRGLPPDDGGGRDAAPAQGGRHAALAPERGDDICSKTDGSTRIARASPALA